MNDALVTAADALLRGPRFASRELEDDYRRHHLRDDGRTATFIMAVILACQLLFVPADFELLRGSPALVWISGVRLLDFALICGLAWAARRASRAVHLDAICLGVALVVTGLSFAIAPTRPRSHVFVVAIDVVVVNAFWTLLPNRFSWQALAAGTYTLSAALVLALFRDPLNPFARAVVINAFVIANVGGAAVAWRAHRTRRRGYVALVNEREARKALSVAYGEAQAANRAKNVFLASVSHEILTPLNAILGFSEVMRRRRNASEDVDALDAIQSSGRALHALLSDVLDLSRGESAEVALSAAPCDLGALLDEARQMIAPRCAEKGISLALDRCADCPILVLDAPRLRQVLLNLLANAVRFTHAGGITVSFAAAPASPGGCDVSIAVSDTGEGVPESEREAVFEPFRQGSNADPVRRGGTGLGLAVSRRLVERMGGRLTLESAPGAGSTFRISLPQVEMAPTSAPADADAEETPALPAATVLVVDDEHWNRALVRAYLAEEPVRVEEAANGEEAMTFLRRERPDAVLLDLRMPGTGGAEVLRWIRAQPECLCLPVLALTAHGRPEEERSGFDGWLGKPVGRRSLLEALAKVLPSAPPRGTRREPAGSASVEAGAAAGSLAGLLPTAAALAEVPHVAGARDLAARVSVLAREPGAGALASWAGELQARADAFDVEGLRAVLARLPEIVTQLG